MIKFYTVIFLSLILALSAVSQPFTAISNPFPGMARGAQAFVDFDNDNDLDLIICGQDNSFSPVAKVYVNTNSEFSLAVTNLKGVYNSALSVADYDHDGLMDFVMTGQDFSGNVTRLYRNLGDFQFQLTDSTLYAAGADGDVAFGDYDNDGFADIVLSGNWNSKLYHNNGDGSFSEVEADLPALNSPSVGWGDYDNDGDPDLLMTGDDGSITTYVMTNTNGSFTRLETPEIEGAVGGSARWADHDLDGYLDILITGKDWSLLPVSFIYHNNSDKTFSNANAGLIGTALGPADWIDYDNDGDLDIMLSGQNAGCGNSSTILYTNDGIGNYSQFTNLNFVERAASAWGDYDNDGDIDLLLTGVSGTATRYFYRNDLIMAPFVPNTPPSIPEITDIFTWEDYGIINWERSTDQQSPDAAITYNMRVGTTPGAINILAPQADISTGARYIAGPGNMGCNVFGILMNLQPGTYYFSLQAIDQAFAASGFSSEQSFIILPTSTNEPDKKNPVMILRQEDNSLQIKANLEKADISIYSIQGLFIKSTSLINGEGSIQTTGITPGMYIVRINSGNMSYSSKIILQR